MARILEITEKIPRPAELEDGMYTGVWGGYVIEVYHKDKLYSMRTDEGVRGSGIKVIVKIKNNMASFEQLSN